MAVSRGGIQQKEGEGVGVGVGLVGGGFKLAFVTSLLSPVLLFCPNLTLVSWVQRIYALARTMPAMRMIYAPRK